MALGSASLTGIRVLELGSTIPGPSAGRRLADLGADVIKVEPPEGDQPRTWGELAPDGTSWRFDLRRAKPSLVGEQE
jgi:formyl-CoA transferase